MWSTDSPVKEKENTWETLTELLECSDSYFYLYYTPVSSKWSSSSLILAQWRPIKEDEKINLEKVETMKP